MQVLNCNWFYKILMGVQRVITGGKDQMKSGSRDADHTEKDQKPKGKEGQHTKKVDSAKKAIKKKND